MAQNTRIERGIQLDINLPSREQLEPIFVVVTLLTLIASVIGETFLNAPNSVVMVLNLTAYFTGGYYAVKAGLEGLAEGEIDVDLLMVAAALGAAVVGEWHEGATLLFLFSLSNVLQAYAIDRSRNAIKSLLNLRPDDAAVRRESEIVMVSIDTLRIGDVVVIRPGDRLPADGVVISGQSAVNQATITGESMPVQKVIGDSVFAGTVNENGTLDVRVTKLASESTLARIITMVEEAQERHSTTQRRLDRFEQQYAKIILAAVALFIVVPPLLGANFSDNFYQAMVLLVVASPCALVISTPASILSGIANAARSGVLFKGGSYLENMGTVKVVAFDKTGTITYGKPSVTDILPQEHLSKDEFLRLLAIAESPSEHPIAQAIVAHAQHLGVREPDDFEALPGRGIRAVIDGLQVLVGNEKLMTEFGLSVPDTLREQQATLENAGKSAMLVYADRWLGVVAVADEVRAGAHAAIQRLRKAGVEHVVMLTGDNDRTAARIAEEVGLTEYYADLLPDEKVKKVAELQARFGPTAMIGDGVNDAPALATAEIGVAMGAAGTDVALETADVVLMADDLSKIPYAIRLSQRARRIVTQNLSFSLGVIIVLVIATLVPFVNVPLPLGVVGHEGSTIIVVLNGLRLLFWRGDDFS